MQNALGTHLGYPSNCNTAGGVFGYLLNDTFTTNRSAGAVNGTNAEPGPGVRTVTDPSGVATISGERLQLASAANANDPRVNYANRPLTRAPGVMLTAHCRLPVLSSRTHRIGFSNSPTTAAANGIAFNSTAAHHYESASGSRTLFTVVAATDYQVWVILRALGHMTFVKGGIFTQPTLLWVGAVNSNPIQYAVIEQGSSTQSASFDYIRVPSARFLPTPLASDSFAAWGTTDGLGHAEVTGLGSGGSGETWTDAVGTWAASGTAAASALDGGIAIATVDTSTADVIATVKVTRSAGNAGLVVRYADSSNYVYALHNGTNAQLIKVVAGTPTTLVNAAASYAAGADLRVICDVTKFRLYYNNALVGTEQTIADAGLASGTKQGLYTSDTGNTFDDLRIFARGTGGEYSALDSF